MPPVGRMVATCPQAGLIKEGVVEEDLGLRAAEHNKGSRELRGLGGEARIPLLSSALGRSSLCSSFSPTESVGGRKACGFPDWLGTLVSALQRSLRNTWTHFPTAQKPGQASGDL